MHYSYKSNGIVSRSLSDYRDNLLSDFSTFRVWEGNKEFTEGQYLTKRISDVNYGTVADYGSEGINSRSKGSGAGSDIQMASGGILIVGERGTSRISGSAECFAKFMPYSPITYGPNGETYYRYEAGTKYETVGEHGTEVINQGIGIRTLASFTFIFDHYTLFSVTGAAESRVYNYHPDEVEEFNKLDYGLISANHTNAIDNGSITTYPASQEDHGFILDGYKTRSGFLRFTDKAAFDAAVFKYLGSGSIRKWGNQQSPSIYGYIADGKVRSFTVLGTADVDFSPASYGRGVLPLRGTSTESFCLEYSGSGSFKKFSGAVESITWNPDEKQMLFSFIGVGSEKQTDNYLGTGLLHTFSGAAESRTASDDIAAGLFRVGGSGHSSETDTYIGSGVFSTFSGLSESTTWNPDEKQLLFSFTGAVQNVEHHQTYVGDGRLFNFSGGEEKQSFAHFGSGVIHLKPRKPVTYELHELANLTLDTAPNSVYWLNTDAGDNTYGWNGPTQIGQVYLKDLNEKDHEKFTVVYDEGAFVEFVRKDYGFLVQTALTNCVANSGTISTNTTATSGCIKVAPGTTLAIAPSNTYTIPNLLTTPSVFEDYGSVANSNAPKQRDYGWILDNSDLRTPYGLGLRFTSQVEVNVNQIFEWTSTGEGYGGSILKFTGITRLPLDVAEYGDGVLFGLSGASECTTNFPIVHGLWTFKGDSHETRRRVFTGSGRIPVFKGAAESLTYNPTERDMLFSFIGVGSEKQTESHSGSGNLFTFSGASEAITNVQVGDGLWRFSGDSHETRSRVFVGSGSFKKFSGAAESTTWNPEERQMLFDFTGVGTEKHTEVFVGSGNLFNFSGASEAVTNIQVGGGLWRFAGDCVESSSNAFVGSGSFKKFSGVVESITFNPDEKQMLFSFTGECIIKNTYGYSGSGNLFKFSGASESATYSPDSFGLFRIIGDSHDTRARALVGTGTFSNLSGAAESITWNPDEKQMLFSFRGACVIRNTYEHVGSGLFSQFSSGTESVRWSAQHTQGLFSVLGDSDNNTTKDFIGSGSFKKFSGAAESTTWNPEEKQMLFSFTGSCVVRNTYEFSGSGRLRSFSKIEAEKGTFDYVGSGSISLKPRKPDVYELRQLSNFTLDFYSLRNGYVNFGDLHFFDQAWTQLGGVYLQWLSLEQGHEKHTEAYNNSACFDEPELDYGYLVNTNLTNCVATSGVINTNTTATSGCIKVATGTTLAIAPTNTYTIPNQLTTPTSSEDYGLVSDANAPERRDYGWILGTLSKVCPFGLYDIIGNAKTHFVENIVSTGYSVTGKAGCSIFGEADTFWTPPYIAQGLGRIIGTVGESWIPWIPPGDGILWSMGGAAETTAQVWKADGLFGISGDAYTLFSLQHFGSGTIRVTGDGAEPRARVQIGSGSLKKFSGAAESLTYNPTERDMLFSFTGEHEVRFTANPPEEGTQVRISGDAFPVFFIPKYPGSGLISITGDSASATTKPFIGSGSFKKFSGAAESITFNPEEKQLLFSFLGTGTERVTLNPPEEGAEIRLRGEGVYKLDISYVGSGTIPISGDAVYKTTKPFVGSGSLKKFSGAAESITFNPEERQLLFSFTGSVTERISSTPPEGIGVIFSFNGAAETTSVSDDLFGGLFRVDGTSIVRSTISHIGSGSFKKFSGAAESVTFNPDEKQMLFSFTGVGEQRTSVSDVGTGSIKIYPEASDYVFTPNFTTTGEFRVYGDGGYRFAPTWIGSGTLKKFSGAAESITFNPEEKQLLFSFVGQGSDKTSVSEISKGGTINIGGVAIDKLLPNNIGSGTIFVDGIGDTRYTPHVIGSGSLWSWSGAAQSFTFNPSDLYTFLKVQGSSPSSKSTIYTGSGSLKKFQGAAESLTFNPDEKQMLFSFLGESATTRTRSESGQGTVKTLGESTSRFSPVFFGSGTTRLSGEVYVTRSRDFVGFGSLKKFSGAAESATFNPLEKQMLFSFIGEGTQARTSKLLSQGGVLTVRGTSGDPLLTFAEQPRVEIDITGDSIDLRTHSYHGSGRITNVHSADEAFVRDDYKGSGSIGTLRGIAFVQVVVWQPPHTQVWII